jgi:type II secretion system protein C
VELLMFSLLKSVFFSIVVFSFSSLAWSQEEFEVPFKVMGVIGQGSDGIAVINYTPTNKTFIARVGLEIDEHHRLLRVTHSYVYFRIRNNIVRVRVGEATGIYSSDATVKITDGVERQGNEIRISTSLRDHLVEKNLAKVLVQAAAIPYFREGSLIGFKLLEIDEGSIYEKAGFLNGDIVIGINGTELTDVGTAVQMLNRLRSANEITLTFERQKEKRSIHLRID